MTFEWPSPSPNRFKDNQGGAPVPKTGWSRRHLDKNGVTLPALSVLVSQETPLVQNHMGEALIT